jgi:hypothetical protein
MLKTGRYSDAQALLKLALNGMLVAIPVLLVDPRTT